MASSTGSPSHHRRACALVSFSIWELDLVKHSDSLIEIVKLDDLNQNIQSPTEILTEVKVYWQVRWVQIEKLTSAHAQPEGDGDTVEDATSSFSLLLWECSDPNWIQLYLGEVSITT